eukprot:TRINITY_DN3356_c0_g6_i2.p1 TRINITY_DN3356_c0_g6~~TRINITY_DN3356_c0_g6_i2.p1  ORF type:complete len:535 (+),score=200.04 TRINITY_DN3356_c0_g6_i2:1735-3339(+)
MPDIVIGGVGIFKKHCQMSFDGKSAQLIPNPNPATAKVFVNGKLIESPTPLNHGDRILFGVHNYFVFNDPSKPENESIDWEYANNEVVEDQVKAMTAEQDGILQQKLKELEEKFAVDKAKAEEEAKAKIEEKLKAIEEKRVQLGRQYEERLQQLIARGGSEEEIAQLKQEMEKVKAEQTEGLKELTEDMQKKIDRNLKKQLEAKDQAEFRLKVQKEVEQSLAQTIPKINEVNEMCLQLGKLDYLYMPTIVTEVDGAKLKPKVCVKIFPDHLRQGTFNQVDVNEFLDKYYMIQEKFQNYQYDVEHNEFIKFEDNKEEDENVFGVGIKSDWRFIGQAHIYTDLIANLLDVKEDFTPLIDDKGNIRGELKYSVVPKLFHEGVEEKLVMYDSIESLEGKTLQVQVAIHGARGLPSTAVGELKCRYKWIDEEGKEFETPVVAAKSINPEFGYEKVHDLYISSYVVSHIWDGSLSIGAYGKVNRSAFKKTSEGNKASLGSDSDARGRETKEISLMPLEGELETNRVTSNDPLVLRRELEL